MPRTLQRRKTIHSIILYGGAAKTYTGEDHNPGDFDLNVFFSTDAEITSTYGMPEIIGTYQGLKVEVMRNRVPENKSIEQYVQQQNSKRWQRIQTEPVIQIFPEIRSLNW